METNKCPKCGAVLGANAPEGLCPRCLMSQGLEEASQEQKPRRSPAMNNDRNLLFGVLAVQLRKVTPVQLMDIAGGWAMDPSRSLQDRLVEAGAISKEDCEFVNDVVDRAIQSHDGDASATLSSFGGDEQIQQSFAGSIFRTPDGEISSGRGVKVGDDPERLDTVEEMPGRYTHISEYSHGGMGRILLVHDQHLGRDIAMKELLPSSPGGAKEDMPQTPVRQAMPMIARFLQEARITGQLEHPAIVPVYELGRRKDGTLYYTMKLVRGETLSQALKSCKSLEDRLKLLPHFLDLCQAIAYAHSLGVIHRDIKPANVMVGQFGETVVIDWGLAKAKGREDIHAKEMEKTMLALRLGKDSDGVHTAYGEAMGTPTYMPPEQAEGKLDIVNERSDVYSLGAVLYEMLTGKVPFSGKNVYDILKKVLQEEPASIQSVAPDVPPELAAICKRAMSKDVNERYADAKELAEEIGRFLSGALVQGYQYGLRELLGRFVRKHKAILATATAATVLLLVGGVASYVQIMQERDNAIVAREAESQAREQAESAQQDLEQQYYQSTLLLANNQIESGASSVAIETLAKAPEHLRHWEWGYLQAAAREHLWATLKGHQDRVGLVSFSPDGQRLLSVSSDCLKVWDVATCQELFTVKPEEGVMSNAEISNDGAIIVTFSTHYEESSTHIVSCHVDTWDARTGEHIVSFVVNFPGTKIDVTPMRTVQISPDGSRVITGSPDNVVKVWDVRTGDELLSLKGHTSTVRCAVYSPDGTRIVTSSWDSTIRVWDAQTGKETLSMDMPVKGTDRILFYPDSQRILISYRGINGGVARDISDGKILFTATLGQETNTDITEISYDGHYFLSRSVYGNTANVYDAETGTLVHTLKGHSGSIRECRFGPDGQRILTAADDGIIKLWSLTTGQELQSISGHTQTISCAAFCPKGDMIASASYDATVKLWDVSMQPAHAIFQGFLTQTRVFCFSQNGTTIISVDPNNKLRVWDLRTGIDKKLSIETPATDSWVSYSSYNQYAIVRSGDQIDVWNLNDQEKAASLSVKTALRFALGKDGQHFANIDYYESNNRITPGHTITIYDTASGKEHIQILGENDKRSLGLAYSPDGKQLGVIWEDTGIVIYETGKYKPTTVLEVGATANGIIFSPDGQYLAMSQWQPNIVTVLDAHSGVVVSTLHLLESTHYLPNSSFSPDGKRIVTVDKQTVRVWETVTGSELLVLKRHAGDLENARFSPDGLKIVAASFDAFYIWNALPWETGDMIGTDDQDMNTRLETANRLNRAKTTEVTTATRTTSTKDLQWTLFQILQIPEIHTSIDDGLDGFLLENTNAPRPLYQFGLAPSDRIFKINDKEIDSSKDFTDALARVHASLESKQHAPLEVTFKRLGQEIQFIFEIKETQVEHHESMLIRALALAAFDLAEANMPMDPDVWTELNREFAREQGEPEDAVTLWLPSYARDKTVKNVLEYLGLAADGRLCSIDGIMINRLDTLLKTLFDSKEKVESGEIGQVTVAVERDDFTRVETVITLTD